MSGYVPIIPFLEADKGRVGVLLSIQGFAGCLSLVPIGLIVDKCGAQPVLEVGVFALAAGTLLTSASSCFMAQLLARTVVGVAGGITFNAGMALIMERFQSAKRTEYIGIALAITTMGNLVGPLVSGQIYTVAHEAGLAKPQAWAFSPAYVLLAVGYFMLESQSNGHMEALLTSEDGGGSHLFVEKLSGASVEKPSAIKHVFHLFCGVYAAAGVRALVLAIALAYLFAAMSAAICAGALELHGLGLMADKIAFACTPAAMAQVVLNPWAGRLASEGSKREALMLAGPMGLAALLFASAMLRELYPGSVLVCVIVATASTSAAVAFCDAPSISMMSDLATMHGRGYGEAVTASELAVTAGQALGPAFGVYALQHYGQEWLLLLLACSALFVGLLCIVFLRQIPHLTQDEGGNESHLDIS